MYEGDYRKCNNSAPLDILHLASPHGVLLAAARYLAMRRVTPDKDVGTIAVATEYRGAIHIDIFTLTGVHNVTI